MSMTGVTGVADENWARPRALGSSSGHSELDIQD